MIALLLCLAAFGLAWTATRRSLVTGLIAVIGVGYAYGILRANFAQAASHFIFDASVLGLYLGWLTGRERRLTSGSKVLDQWLVVLMAWPALLLLLPAQEPLIQLVGLRGNVFFLPFLLLGAKLNESGLRRIALGLAALNLAAFGFALAEFQLGIERFFPYNAVTDIIYRSNDLLNYQAYRIPATFSSSHAYAGTMVITLPFLIGAWVQPARSRSQTLLLAGGAFAGIVGVFMAAARSHTVVLFLLLLSASFFSRWRGAARLGWLVILLVVAGLVSGDARLQRFTTLSDTEYVTNRVAGSINEKFFDLAHDFPMGNGLGGGGTSVPYFLENRLRHPVAMESEYARIMLEQGIPGLALWIGFLVWVFTRRTTRRADAWHVGRRLAWTATAAYFASGLIGVGLLTSVPQTCLLLLATGWIAVPEAAPSSGVAPVRERPRRSSADRELAHGPV